jgi:shikimate dehydrogenase
MPLYGLIGHPVTHSFSKDFFQRLFLTEGLKEHHYELFDLPQIEMLPELIRLRQPSGLNVTIPHKESVLKYIDHVDAIAAETGAVNCLKMVDGKVHGYNTDYLAFRETITGLDLPSGIAALVFGSGGSSRAVTTVLRHLNIPYLVVSRTADEQQLAYQQLNHKIITGHPLLINCTPVGMWPAVEDRLSLPFESISKNHIAYDLIYNPAETGFLKECRLRGARIKNGSEMLELQALASWEIWNRQD